MNLNLHKLGTILDSAFPDLAPVGELEQLATGFESHAVATAEGHVFRIGRTQEAAMGYMVEKDILPRLRGILGPLVPTLIDIAEPSCELPYGAICTSRLPGLHPRWGVDPPDSLMRDIGTFTARLHALPPSEFTGAPIQERDARSELLKLRSPVMPALKGRLYDSEYRTVETWWIELELDQWMKSSRPVVSHRDLWHENLLIDGAGHLSGVLDWSSISIGDPAADFAPLKYFGDDAFSAAVDAYVTAGGQWDELTAHRSARYYEGREFDGFAWAIRHRDQEELEDSIRKLRRGPIFGG